MGCRVEKIQRGTCGLQSYGFPRLRQPLNNISISCQAVEVLGGDKLDKESKGYLKMVIVGIEQMNGLIDTLLRFARSAHIELHMKTVDLTMIARVITANLRLTYSGRQEAFRIAEGLTSNGDSELLQVVLENLLGNAWKYTGRQGETVIDSVIILNGLSSILCRKGIQKIEISKRKEKKRIGGGEDSEQKNRNKRQISFDIYRVERLHERLHGDI